MANAGLTTAKTSPLEGTAQTHGKNGSNSWKERFKLVERTVPSRGKLRSFPMKAIMPFAKKYQD